jgi:anti-anti-sigma factor
MLEYNIPARLDAVNSAEVEEQLLAKIAENGATEVACNFSDTVYISSAGLRVMLVVSKKMAGLGGKCTLRGMNDDVYGIFEMAGFNHIIDIER